MDIKITNQTENKLFSRKEVSFEIKHNNESTPSRKDIMNYFAVKLKSPVQNIIIKKISSKFGYSNSNGLIYAYDSEAKLKEIEDKKQIEKQSKILEKINEENAPAEEEQTSEEAPAEEEKPAEE
jgi:ribosomal protein S24E